MLIVGALTFTLFCHLVWPFLPLLFRSFFVVKPDRPQPTNALLDDGALAIQISEIPKVPAEWREDVIKRHKPIRSLVSDDFSDLAFLEPLLEGKRIVLLGEHIHGVAEFNWLKVRLVKYLHQKLNYDVVAFESPMTACINADRLVATESAVNVMEACLFGVWQTTEVRPLFEYISTSRKSKAPLTIAGFDTQDLSEGVGVRFKALLSAIAPQLAEQVDYHEKRLIKSFKNRELSDAERESSVAFYDEVAKTLANHTAVLESHPLDSSYEAGIAVREAYSRIALLHQIAAGMNWIEASNLRDERMAQNLEFLLDNVYRGRKVIVWAHNFHINYAQGSMTVPVPMGEWLAKSRRSEMYSIGLFMGQGVVALNGRQLSRIALSERDQLSAVMANAGRRMSFVDFSRAKQTHGSAWIFEPIVDRMWLIDGFPITPINMFDAAIYIHRVTPQEYVDWRW